VLLWNSESSLPSGLVPTILDRAIGLPAQRWLDVDPMPDVLYARDDARMRPNLPQATKASGGSDSSTANADPR
jgi:beta-lactamase class C